MSVRTSPIRLAVLRQLRDYGPSTPPEITARVPGMALNSIHLQTSKWLRLGLVTRVSEVQACGHGRTYRYTITEKGEAVLAGDEV